MIEAEQKSQRCIEIRQSLSAELRPIDDEMGCILAFYSLKYHGREWVSYQDTDLVREVGG